MKVKTMNTNQKLAIVLALFALALTALAQVPASKPLSDAEQKGWQQLTQGETSLLQAYGQAENALLNSAAGDGCESVKLHANFQEAGLRLSLIRARRDAFIWRLRAEKDCADCVVSADGKKLEAVKKDGGK